MSRILPVRDAPSLSLGARTIIGSDKSYRLAVRRSFIRVTALDWDAVASKRCSREPLSLPPWVIQNQCEGNSGKRGLECIQAPRGVNSQTAPCQLGDIC